MRQLPMLRMILVLMLGLGIPFLARAQASSVKPNDEQRAQLDAVQGVGKLKFGAQLSDFANDEIKPHDKVDVGEAYFEYLKKDDITWGTLTPTRITLTFFSGKLCAISMHFVETRGALIALSRAVMEKYGMVPQMQFGRSPTARIDIHGDFINPTLPNDVSPGYLEEKASTDVTIFDCELRNQLVDEQAKATKTQYEKQYDLDKMKANM